MTKHFAPKTAIRESPMSAVTIAFLENNTFLKRFLMRFLYRPQDIEDVAQEAFLRAYVAEQHNEIDQPKAFLFRIARNVALTRLSRKSRQITDYLEETTEPGVTGFEAGTDEELEAQESIGLYCEAVAALPEKCRQVFLLRKVHGLSHREIAERLSLSVSSVEKYLRSGLLACRAFIREREGAGVVRHAHRQAPAHRTKGKL